GKMLPALPQTAVKKMAHTARRAANHASVRVGTCRAALEQTFENTDPAVSNLSSLRARCRGFSVIACVMAGIVFCAPSGVLNAVVVSGAFAVVLSVLPHSDRYH